MNRGRPVATLARFLHWQIRSRLREEVMIDWVGGARLAVRRGMRGATGNIYCGLHEYVDMSFLLDTLGPGDLFVDIGANVGSYTVLASKVRGARTIAVEPDPYTVRALRRNVAVNDIANLVTVVEAALGAAEGRVAFTTGLDTVNRVASPDAPQTRQVALRKLDTLLEGAVPKLVKIDVEGFEAEVFAGAMRLLHDPALWAIITEGQDETVLRLLTQAGFRRAHYDPVRKTIVQSSVHPSPNALFVRGDRMPGTERPSADQP